MAISQTNYVDITSAVAGDSAAAAPSLQHRRMTSGTLTDLDGNPAVAGQVVTVTYGMLEILNKVLGSSADRAFAQQYFSIKTTAPTSKPSSLQFVNFQTKQQSSDSTLSSGLGIADLQNASGQMTVTSTAGSETIALPDFSEEQTVEDIALAIGSRLAGPAGVTVSVESGLLTITYPETGSHSGAVLFASGEGADALGLAGTGAIVVIGGIVTAVDAYILSRQANKNFGSFSIEGLQSEDQAELTKLKNYHMSYNLMHQLYIELDSKTGVTALPVYTTFDGVPMTGFILSETTGEHKAVIPAALIDATDFEGRNTVNQVMYRQASGMTPDVCNDIDKLRLDGQLINYYGLTSVNATPLSFFQKGNLMGGVADPRDMMVAACEQWIKGKIASDLINTLVVSRIPANLDGRTRIRTIITNGAVQTALRSGAIIKLKELTQHQKEAILDITGDELAAMDVFNNGFWLDVEIRTVVVDGVEEKHVHYVLIYSKADFVRKIVGSNNLI